MAEVFDGSRGAAHLTNDDFESAAEEWLQTKAVASYDALKADPSRGIPREDVRAVFEAKWTARSRRPGKEDA